MLSFRVLDRVGIQPCMFWLDDPDSRRWTGADQETVDDVLRAGTIWLASDGPQAVSLVLAALQQDGSSSITLIVCPTLRGRGYGRQTLLELRLHCLGRRIAAVHRDHVVSRHCFESCGYVQIEAPNEAGCALYEDCLDFRLSLPEHQQVT